PRRFITDQVLDLEWWSAAATITVTTAIIAAGKQICWQSWGGTDKVARPFARTDGFFFFHVLMSEAGNLKQQLDTFLRRKPKLRAGVYIARGAVVVGDVTIGDYSSVWYNAVVRGDINRIEI